MTASLERPLRIFLAEDNRADVYLVELALKEHQLPFVLRMVNDGEEALKAVSAFGSTEPIPQIALLDLNLPRQEGDQVLRTLRSQPGCETIPIIVMTSSDSSRDKAMAEKFGAVFFLKPSDLTGFLQLGSLVKDICQRASLNL